MARARRMNRRRFSLSPSFLVACVLGAGRIIASGGRDASAWQEAAAIIGLAASPGIQPGDRGLGGNDYDADGIPDDRDDTPYGDEPPRRARKPAPGVERDNPAERPSQRRGPVMEWE